MPPTSLIISQIHSPSSVLRPDLNTACSRFKKRSQRRWLKTRTHDRLHRQQRPVNSLADLLNCFPPHPSVPVAWTRGWTVDSCCWLTASFQLFFGCQCFQTDAWARCLSCLSSAHPKDLPCALQNTGPAQVFKTMSTGRAVVAPKLSLGPQKYP